MRITKDFKEFTNGCGIGKKFSTIFLNPCFHCVCLYRLSDFFYHIHLSLISKIIWYVNRFLFHADIDYRADLAGGFFLIHGLGTVIGKDVVSEGRLKVYQNVTLGGGNRKPPRLDSDGKYRGMPLFKDNCTVYTGATVVGGIVIKNDTIIRAGSIISKSID